MQGYPAYRLEDFYRKSFLEGGLTYSQLVKLFDYQMKSLEDEYRFHAAIHGIDLDESVEQSTSSSRSKSTSGSESQFIFRDPAEYENMTDEEKTKATREMMTHWRGFSLKNTPKQ